MTLGASAVGFNQNISTPNPVSRSININESQRTITQGDAGSQNYNFFTMTRDVILGAKTVSTSSSNTWLTSDLANYPNGSTSSTPGSYYIVNGEVVRVKVRVVAATQPTTTFGGLKTWEINALVYRVNGTTTIMEESKPSTSVGDTTGWDAVLMSSGDYVGVAVTGSTTVDVHWGATWEQTALVVTGAAGGK
jgi:hypothetical protein